MFGIAGVLHWVKPEPFDSIVPEQLPGKARAYTYASGVAELACAGLLAAPRFSKGARAKKLQRLGGIASAGLLAAVWPANINMAWQWRNKPWYWQVISIGRIPLQIPLIRDSLALARR